MYPSNYDTGDYDTCNCGWTHKSGCSWYEPPEPVIPREIEDKMLCQCMGCGVEVPFKELRETGACKRCTADWR